MNRYLEPSEFIDWQHPDVQRQARKISTGLNRDRDIAQACFEFVRDEIQHSFDYSLNPVTCKASEVLMHRTGYCYAKSHLLAALLRANGIPAGLCYQRLTIDNNVPPFCLHGLNAVYLANYGWYRIDARGNKPGVNAEFCPPIEKLAFSIVCEGEADLPEVWSEPLANVTQALIRHKTYQEVCENLPDIEIANLQ